MARDADIPTGRIRRAAKVGRLAGEQVARGYATKAANLGRSHDGRRAAAERRQLEAAEQVFEVLGQMKGAAMKVGQVASLIDTGAFPPELQERIQAKMAELRDAAPRVPFKRMRAVVEEDLDAPLDELFEEFSEEAVAAASIGQVYRARLHDGREVAVKVQYPGVAQAVRSDLQNLGLFMQLMKRMAPGLDVKAVAQEIRERVTDELDYELEAQSHRAMARAWRGHPFVFVPDVVTRMCSEHVLVTEWAGGAGFEEVRTMDQAVRDRFGEIVFRFFFGSLYRNGHFSGDPHPGNYLLLDDGRVAFLDFGMTKHLDRADIDGEVAAIRYGMERDAVALHAQLAALGFFDVNDERIPPDAVLDHFHDVTRWYIDDAVVKVDRELAAAVAIDLGDPRSAHWELMRRETLPPQTLLARRMEVLTLGVLSQLEATANWHRIAREWLFGDPPSTPLGEQDEEFFAPRRAA